MRPLIRPVDGQLTAPCLVWWKVLEKTAKGNLLINEQDTLTGSVRFFDICFAPDKLTSAVLTPGNINLLADPSYNSTDGIIVGAIGQTPIGAYRAIVKAPAGTTFSITLTNAAGTQTKTFANFHALPISYGLIQPAVDYHTPGQKLRLPYTYWNGGEYFRGGFYRVTTRLSAALHYNGKTTWQFQGSDMHPSGILEGYYIKYSASVRMAGTNVEYATQTQCKNANLDHFQEFIHEGGPIGMHFLSKDSTENYADNNPSFELAQVPTITPIVPDDYVTPNILAATPIAYFNNGASIPAGTKKVKYTSGAMRYGIEHQWSIHFNLGGGPRFQILHSGGSTIINGPGDAVQYGSQALVELANANAEVTFSHAGGTIGMRLVDDPYADNISGSPNPTFLLQ
jgi:hypothetical protein